ncbi:hypothetical protein [Fischerella sp. PCC 9605]|uniref:hypothetical protein n=1 Tax=Fischerella sp. PCC 9605 TaxID=1173024 RepID=UPI0012DCECD4|nr:hypothetical protein [Fischerella sp. PCC 9605]
MSRVRIALPAFGFNPLRLGESPRRVRDDLRSGLWSTIRKHYRECNGEVIAAIAVDIRRI